MNAPRIVCALALADFRERTRRYSFLVTLLFAVYLGYAAARGQISLRLGEYRGLYTSAWIGAMMSLITTTFLSLVGFYIVKNAIDRDRQTGVGGILAATPVSRITYLLGKFTSDFAVLASMVGVLALAAVAMQYVVAEDRQFHWWALLSPFLLLSIPAMAITAALAVLFETAGWLRGGFGNVVWFFLWSLAIGLPGLTGVPQVDPFGLWTVYRSIVPAARATIPGYRESFSLTIADRAAKVFPGFRWDGMAWTAEGIALRVAWVLVAFLFVLLAAAFFDRFDPSRSAPRFRAPKKPKQATVEMTPSSAPTFAERPSAVAIHLTPLGPNVRNANFSGIFVAELRLALKGYPWWWYVVGAGLIAAQLASPLDVARGPLLAVAWIWPVLIWSALGTRENRFGTQQLLFSCARVLPRQLPAVWLAGVALAAILGAGTGTTCHGGANHCTFGLGCGRAVCALTRACARGLERHEQVLRRGLHCAVVRRPAEPSARNRFHGQRKRRIQGIICPYVLADRRRASGNGICRPRTATPRDVNRAFGAWGPAEAV